MDMEINGLDEVKNYLNNIKNNTENLAGKNDIQFDDLFNSTFMNKYTDFNSIDDMFGNSQYDIHSQEDFKEIPDTEWDVYINENTTFSDWNSMLEKAVHEWTINQLDLD